MYESEVPQGRPDAKKTKLPFSKVFIPFHYRPTHRRITSTSYIFTQVLSLHVRLFHWILTPFIRAIGSFDREEQTIALHLSSPFFCGPYEISKFLKQTKTILEKRIPDI